MILLALLRLFLLAWTLGPDPDGQGPRSLRPSLVRILLGSRKP